jgi:hypothetical protein
MLVRITVLSLAGLLILGLPAASNAQPAWDASAFAGVFAGSVPTPGDARYSDDWFHTGQAGVIVGRHITSHLKVELEAAVTGGGRQFVTRFVTVPGIASPYPVGSEVTTAVRTLVGAATWQFFDNEWVHPFVTAGVAADFERRSVHVWEQRYYPTDPRTSSPVIVAADRRDGPETSRVMRALLGGGAKLYVNERAFIRADGRVSLGADAHNVALRIGVGFDF